MTTFRKIISLIVGSLISSVVCAQSPGQPVTPKQFFPSSILNVYAPDSEGWVLAGAGSYGILFGKKGTDSAETYGAQVIFFEMPSTTGEEALIDFVKNRIAVLNPPPRFQETNSSYQYTEERGYPCVNVHIDFDDKAAVTPNGKEELKLQVISLYCRHPEQQRLGFFLAYSHRGKTADDQIEAAARNFIEAINIPKK